MQVAYLMKKAVFLRIVLTAAVLALLLSGCRFVRVEEEERKPVDYIVVERRDIRRSFPRLMEEKKEKEFQLSYETGEDLYLAKGTGADEWRIQHPGRGAWRILEWDIFCYKTSWTGGS